MSSWLVFFSGMILCCHLLWCRLLPAGRKSTRWPGVCFCARIEVCYGAIAVKNRRITSASFVAAKVANGSSGGSGQILLMERKKTLSFAMNVIWKLTATPFLPKCGILRHPMNYSYRITTKNKGVQYTHNLHFSHRSSLCCLFPHRGMARVCSRRKRGIVHKREKLKPLPPPLWSNRSYAAGKYNRCTEIPYNWTLRDK